MKNNAFIKGAIVLVVCNLIGKILGAIYRIPLAGIVGGTGMGQYQLVFPLYALVLTVSTSGIPAAISKLTAAFRSRGDNASVKKLLKVSILLLTIVSLVGVLIVVLGARFISSLQGNPEVYICYYAIAPAVLFVGVLSAFRGYFQGHLFMFPTAISGIVEQFFKVVLGLTFASRFMQMGTEFAVFGALLGVSVSEFFAFIFLFVCYLFHRFRNKVSESSQGKSYKEITRDLVKTAVPITLGGLISPLSTILDNILIINILMSAGFSSGISTTMLGIQSGVVEPLINIPIIIAVSISTAILPNLSSLEEKGNAEGVRHLIEKGYQTTLSIALVCAICFVIFGEQVITFLYGTRFDYREIDMAVRLLMLGSLNVIALSLVQVTSGILQGLNHSIFSAKMMIFGCALKLVLDATLIRIPSINIYGAIISGIVSFSIVFVINYFKIKKLTNASAMKPYFYVSVQVCLVCMFAFVCNNLFQKVFTATVSMFMAGIVAILIFAGTYYLFFMMRDDIRLSKKTN